VPASTWGSNASSTRAVPITLTATICADVAWTGETPAVWTTAPSAAAVPAATSVRPGPPARHRLAHAARAGDDDEFVPHRHR
jgi:hypothetical protein